MGDCQNSKDECEEFLARQKPWVQAVLKGEHGSPDILPALAEPGGIKELYKVQDEYEDLLKRCPKHLRQYRKYNAGLHLGPIRRGRPASPQVQEQGRRAAELFKQGKTWGEIAHRLCLRKIEPGHKCNKLCADRLRQSAQPYLT